MSEVLPWRQLAVPPACKLTISSIEGAALFPSEGGEHVPRGVLHQKQLQH